MRIATFAILLTILAVPAALADCASVVWDRTGQLDPSAIGELGISASKLTDLGADIHIVTFSSASSVAAAESQLEQECPSWLGPSGVRASTLLVVGVSPTSHKSWISYGSAWHHALDDNFNRIRTDYMNPFFKNHEWAKGLSAGVDALAARITAAKDESLHPAAQETTVEATDLKPVASVIEIIFEVAGVVLAIWLLGWWAMIVMDRRRKTRIAQQAASLAQQAASLVRSNLASRMQKLDEDISAYSGLNLALVTSARDRLSEDFSRYSNSEKTNPDTKGLSASEYDAIKAIYGGLLSNLEGCYRVMRPGALPEEFSAAATSTAYARRTNPKPHSWVASSTQQPSTVVVQGGNSSFSDGFLGGLIGGELASRPSEAPAPRYDPPAPSYDPPSSSSSSWGSSDSGGGGGSDWSSSSDSGGGGGSDFGGGSDSGGGGGGDW